MKQSKIFYSFTSGIGAITACFVLLISLSACTSAQAEDAVPQRLAVIQLKGQQGEMASAGDIVIGSNDYVYITNRRGSIEVFNGIKLIASIDWPEHNGVKRSFAQIVAHPDNGYIYLSDGGRDTVHVIDETAIIASLHIGGREARYLTIDEQNGYVYVVGRKQSILPDMIPINTLGIIDGAQIIGLTEWQKVDTGSIAYNPVDGYIYLGQLHDPLPYKQSLNLVLQLNTSALISTTMLPNDEYGGVHKIVVNRKTGEMYMLKNNSGVLYWDGEEFTEFRVPPLPHEKGYVLEDIAVDT